MSGPGLHPIRSATKPRSSHRDRLGGAKCKPPGCTVGRARELTVLACDVAGLGEPSICLDLEDLCEMTTACHRCCMDIIERYHGYVANYAADGVLAYFGYPQADEHDAERAIRARPRIDRGCAEA